MQNTAEQNHSGLVASYDTRPGNEVGLFYNAPSPHGVDSVCIYSFIHIALAAGPNVY